MCFFYVVSLCQCVPDSLNVLKSCTGRTGCARVIARVNVLELLLIAGMHRSNGYFALPYILSHYPHTIRTHSGCSVLAIHHMYVKRWVFVLFGLCSASILGVHWLCVGVFGLCILFSHCVIYPIIRLTMCRPVRSCLSIFRASEAKGGRRQLETGAQRKERNSSGEA